MSFYNSTEIQWTFNNQESYMFGLINQGSTCYLNSVLQVLFRTRGFRDAVNRDNTHGTAFIDPVLKALFQDLNRQTAETVQVTNKLGIDRVNQQRDAAEYFEKILTLCSEEASQVFQGKMTNRTVCTECNDRIDEETEFWSLPLALVKSHGKYYSVVDGIQEFFKESCLDEDNQLYCEDCGHKCDALSKSLITCHPVVLVLLLKRFEFNYNYMSYVKNDQFVDVPHTINIPENQIYEIYAFVEHFGSLKSGHYTATIRCQDGKEDRWFCFNDSCVTLMKHQPFQEHETLKSQSAYLLFYKRKSGGFPDNRDVSKSRGVLHDVNRNPAHCQNVENKQDEEDELKRDEEVRTDTCSDARPRRSESGLSIEAGQNTGVFFHQSRPSLDYQDNQHVKMEGEDRKSHNTAASDQEGESFDENMRKKRKVDVKPVKHVTDENVEGIKEATEKPDTGMPASGNLQQVQRHSPAKHGGDKPERESSKQNQGEKVETTHKMHRSHDNTPAFWSVKRGEDQKASGKRSSSKTKDFEKNQSKRGQEEKPKPTNDASGKRSAKKQKTEGSDEQNEIIESSLHPHTKPETLSQEKVQQKPKTTKSKRFWKLRKISWKKSKKPKDSEDSERVEEESETGNRMSSNGVENNTAAHSTKKTKQQERIPDSENEMKTRGETSKTKKRKKTISCFSF
ncbi:ubiquitin carboxyl-terminal hydrolase 47-like isoform X2 [Oryzias latipes]|uniref:ubiquitin carboxyl-terminal hydrolase 47-like isoform X2 n=1 Tax=Oryzias latipes TaxID=8090 RepID=UPI0005CC3348|nr:ubiquitin carboxyl-terminal hydrolase 47-like isoform X2 [Oryzias latipes]